MRNALLQRAVGPLLAHTLRIPSLPDSPAPQVGAGGFLVLRPDSGDPVEAVLQGLRAAEKVFGFTTNSRGFRVPVGCSVLQARGCLRRPSAARQRRLC